MEAADIMTRQVVTIAADAPIAQAVHLMLDHRISGLPVVGSTGRLIGIVTEGDFLRRAETGTEMRRPRWLEMLRGPGRLASDYVRTHARRVEDVMTPNVASVTEDTPVDEIVRLMERRRIKRVPVVRNGEIVGIVSRANLLRVLAGLIAAVPPDAVNDAALRERVLAEFDKLSWAPRASIDVVVRDGVVDLSGTILDDRERLALRVATENVTGVKGVEDHLCWVEPMSGYLIGAPESDAAPSSPAERQALP